MVVPVKDEAGSLRDLAAELTAAFADTVGGYEIVFVDDGSSDGTVDLIRELAAAAAMVRLVVHPHNLGKTAALLTGARAARAEILVTVDGDGQNDPRDARRLYEHLRSLGDAAAVRLIAGWRQRRADTWLKRLSSRLANRVRGGILGDRTPDTACGLKVMRRDDFLQLPRFQTMHRFLPALIRAYGGLSESLPVTDRPRSAGRSKYGLHNRLWVGLLDLVGVWWLTRRRVPSPGVAPGSER